MPCTYQLHIKVKRAISVEIGRLGRFNFPAGHYIYTGSAKRNMAARIARHLIKEKNCRWHIDYLLVNPYADVMHVTYSEEPECLLNQATKGETIIRGFGASDCRQHCLAHLKLTHRE